MLSGVAVMAAWSAVGQLYRVLVFPTANLIGKVRVRLSSPGIVSAA